MKKDVVAVFVLGALGAVAFAPLFGAAAEVAVPSDSNASAAEAAGGGLQEIVVTAQRRSESVQKSSLSIDVLSNAALANGGVSRASDLQNVIPGLTTASSGLNFSTYIRGVGSFNTDASSDSSIAYNINGVFISRPNGLGAIFFDLDRVEVLKGPQGTLYGRNASGGAINLITSRPTFEPTGELEVEAGNYDLKRILAVLSGPVSDTLALRLAATETKHNGYLTDGYDDEDDKAVRLSALWKPTENFSTLLIGEYTRQLGNGTAGVYRSSLRPGPADPWTGPSQSPQPQTAQLGGDSILSNGYVDATIAAVSAEINWDFGPATLTFIPAYRTARPTDLTYQPGFFFDTMETSSQQSYELRLSNQSDRLKWVGGIYYFEENQSEDYTLLARPIQQNNVLANLTTNSYAAFGEATYSVTDPLRIIGGLRYSQDDKGQNGVSYDYLPFPSSTSNYGRRVDNNVSFKVGAEYDLTPANMLFATVATGYKAGGFVPDVPAPNNTYKPETLTAYTLGSRNRFLDNRLQLNAEAFYWKYKNKQERFLGELPSGGTGLLTTNAGEANIYGFNLDAVAKTGGNGTLRANVEYLHSRYESFNYNVVNSGPFGYLGYSTLATTCALGPVGPVTPVGTQQSVNCAGKPLPHAPTWSGSVGYDYVFDLTSVDTLTPHVAMKFASSMYLSPDFIPSAEDNGYTWFDGDVTYAHSKISVTAWIRNITNQAVYSGGYRYPFSISEKAPPGIAGDPTTFYADIRPPRTYGITLKASF